MNCIAIGHSDGAPHGDPKSAMKNPKSPNLSVRHTPQLPYDTFTIMPAFYQYFDRIQTVRGGFGSLPPWARSIVGFFALPGILLAVLSLLLFLVSILALLLLTVPVYRLLQVVTGSRSAAVDSQPAGSLFDPQGSPGRKQVDVRVVE